MTRPRTHSLNLVIVMLLGLLVAASAVAEEKTVKTVRIEKIVTGEDGESRVVIIGDGAEGGEHHSWVSAGAGHSFAFSHAGHGGKGGFLGVGMSEMTPELLEHFGVSAEGGVMVSEVVEDSPAYRAGLEVGDIITGVDDQPVTSARRLAHAVRTSEPGRTVALEVWRDGGPMSIRATLDESEDRWTRAREIFIRCDDGEDCTSFGGAFAHTGEAFDCGDAEECEIEITCEDGDCTCAVNGEATACSELGGLHVLDGE